MTYNRPGRKVVLAKFIQCSCGAESKLMKRRNFSHGRKSKGRSYMLYKCTKCGKENPLIKSREGKK